MICSSPEGFLQYMSSFEMHSTSDFDPIAFDQGVIPDVYLDVPEVDGVPDYSSYFDIGMLGAIMDELHPVKEHSTFYDAALALIIALVFVGALLVRNRVKV